MKEVVEMDSGGGCPGVFNATELYIKNGENTQPWLCIFTTVKQIKCPSLIQCFSLLKSLSCKTLNLEGNRIL